MTPPYIAIDTETGGIYPSQNPLLSIGAVASWMLHSPLTIYVLPAPWLTIDPEAAALNGYTPERWKVRGAVPLEEAMKRLSAWLEQYNDWSPWENGARIVAHNSGFDRSFLEESARVTGIRLPGRHSWRCSMNLMARLMDKGQIPPGSCSLDRLGELAHLWPAGGRGPLHDVTLDAYACLRGYDYLLQLDR